MVEFEKVGQRLPFFEWDDGQKSIAHQSEVLGGLWPSVAVIIFQPATSVAFVVVFVFYRPVGADRTGGPRPVLGIDTGEENARCALFFSFRVVFLTPMTNDFERRACPGQPDIHGFEGGNGGLTTLNAAVTGFCAQLKRGALLSAFSAACKRLEVFSLVPKR